MRRGGSLLPRATPSSSPMPSASICFSSRISTAAPPPPAIVAARAANSRGVSVLPGSLAELAREVAALAQHPTSGHQRVDSRQALRRRVGHTRHRDRATRWRRRRWIARLVAGAVELGERQPLGHRLRKAGDVDVASRIGLARPQHEPDVPHPPLTRRQGSDRGDPPGQTGIEAPLRTAAHEHDTACLPAVIDHRGDELVEELGGELAGCKRPRDLAARRVVQARHRLGRVAFEPRHDDQLDVER